MSENMVPVMTLTDQGADLIARSITEGELYLTRLAMGDGQLPNVGSIPGLLALIHETVSVAITRKIRKGNSLTISGQFELEPSASSFRWRELGVFGHIDSEDDVLIGYLYKGEAGEMVRPADGVERTIYITLELDPAADVTVVLAPQDTVYDLVGDASLISQLVPGQHLFITSGEAVVGVTDDELEGLSDLVDELVDGEGGEPDAGG